MSRVEAALDAYNDCIIDEIDLRVSLFKVIRDHEADEEERKRAALRYHFKLYDEPIWDSGFDFTVRGVNYTVSQEPIDGLKLEGKANVFLIYVSAEQPGD